ncbi:protein tyrosine phosphatase family protein [Shewanella waksmanii]|uniref:protein tyrosine phosphatase family protein n=1 Tax=Shewanella waksmanii TaxID=213783 RepID=UPI003735DD11
MLKKLAYRLMLLSTLILFSSQSTMAKPSVESDATNGLNSIKALQVHGNVMTAGLPTKQEFALLSEAGVTLVVNLIPQDNPNGLANEAQLVKDAGMEYVNIEVDWQQPLVSDVEQFFDVMQANQHNKVLVHCAANYRASAFYYLYLAKYHPEQADQSVVMAPWGDLQQSLNQYPQWQALIDKVQPQ